MVTTEIELLAGAHVVLLMKKCNSMIRGVATKKSIREAGALKSSVPSTSETSSFPNTSHQLEPMLSEFSLPVLACREPRSAPAVPAKASTNDTPIAIEGASSRNVALIAEQSKTTTRIVVNDVRKSERRIRVAHVIHNMANPKPRGMPPAVSRIWG